MIHELPSLRRKLLRPTQDEVAEVVVAHYNLWRCPSSTTNGAHVGIVTIDDASIRSSRCPEEVRRASSTASRTRWRDDARNPPSEQSGSSQRMARARRRPGGRPTTVAPARRVRWSRYLASFGPTPEVMANACRWNHNLPLAGARVRSGHIAAKAVGDPRQPGLFLPRRRGWALATAAGPMRHSRNDARGSI